jgi:3-hydroxyisobutyrate dehydrogenase-like beta-hydroxyacid dehydrogenase
VVGTASLAKLATNLLVGLNTAALAEALVFGARGGLDKAKLLEAWEGTAASSRMMEVRGPLMADGRYAPQMTLELFMKDLGLMLAEGRRLNTPLPLTETAKRLYQAASDAGWGSEDLASVMTTLETMANRGRKRG